METINGRFRQLRENLNLSQEEFARRINRTRSEIKNIEYEKTSPKEEIILSVCAAFGVNDDWLRNGDGNMFRPVNRDTEIASFMGNVMRGEDDDFRRRIIAVLAKLDASEWDLLEKMALKLANERKKGD